MGGLGAHTILEVLLCTAKLEQTYTPYTPKLGAMPFIVFSMCASTLVIEDSEACKLELQQAWYVLLYARALQ